MPARRARSAARFRVGRVSVYLHHASWWVYYRAGGRQVRRKVSTDRSEAEKVAAQANAQLAAGAPTLFAFSPISVPDLRREFLNHHENVLNSTIATVRRYSAATRHLEDFVLQQPRPPQAHEVRPDAFAAYLRTIEVAPNGHPNTCKRRLRDKGVQFILETSRAMFSFAGKRRHLPPYAGNPFTELPIDKLKIEDAKPIFVFDTLSELAFLTAADDWQFPLHFTLAKAGVRVGELTHLLIEEVDLANGWLWVRNKLELGWRVKTGRERAVPLLPEAVAVLRAVIGKRTSGPVFLRRRFMSGDAPPLGGDRSELSRECEIRQRGANKLLDRSGALYVSRGVWRDAGAIKADTVRTSFIRLARAISRPEATCPKSWRHTFATLLQDANVDPLIRQLTLGHQVTAGGLGMTANYTHTRPETHKQQIEQALRRWPASLELALQRLQGGKSC